MRSHEERDEVDATEDARATARRIVEQVLADHHRRACEPAATTPDDGAIGAPLVGRLPRRQVVPATASTAAADPSRDAARQTARRIVDEVLASYASPRPTLTHSGAAQAAVLVEPTTAAPGRELHEELHEDGTAASHGVEAASDDVDAASGGVDAAPDGVTAAEPAGLASAPDVAERLFDRGDDHPLATARRIVEQVLGDVRAREQAVAPGVAAPAVGAARTAARPAVDEPLADRLFVVSTDTPDGDAVGVGEVGRDVATVPSPTPDPGPAPEPPRPPIPEPGPFPTPDPLPDPEPFPQPDPEPQPAPTPPDPEPQPMTAPDGPSSQTVRPAGGVVPSAAASAVPVRPKTPERRFAEDAARRIVQEVVATHEQAARERAAREREERERAEHARLTEHAVILEEVGLGDEALVAEQTRIDEVEAAEQARLQEEWLAEIQPEAGPYLDELPHPDPSVPPLDGPPPIPELSQREAGATAPLGTQPLGEAATTTSSLPTVELPSADEDQAPRTGRWLLTTIIGAVSLALLFPLAVQALRSLVPLG